MKQSDQTEHEDFENEMLDDFFAPFQKPKSILKLTRPATGEVVEIDITNRMKEQSK